jgi:acyl-CoA synthetase (AMP-forming)/AMP-acid ligase II/thioesterase domain-containing protein
LAPDRPPLSHGQLADGIADKLRQFREAGLGPEDRIAVVLPNGPEMAIALLSVMVSGAAAPLNPNYSRDEFDFYLADLEPRALLIDAGVTNPARDVAAAKGIPTIDLQRGSAGDAGAIRLTVPAVGPPIVNGGPSPDDIALLLHTSGTTSRPKLVPLTQSNLYFSARNIGRSLELKPEDRCLNVMPLFHIHGLVAAVVASLAAGGSVVCTPGFLAHEFLSWIDEYRPTWYTAVPTIHQSVLARAREMQDFAAPESLRFVRSCSAALSPSVMLELENLFGVPVCEAYGMTEAAHQMACNPLPPRPRKQGSVGLPTGIEITVMDESGHAVPEGAPGEIAIRGNTVTAGYLNNGPANEAAFCGGWLRTGDIGYFDADGYLFLNGRAKELINRGGEKISPREVEDALLTHPAIAQAAAFGMPEERLGEVVAAVAVLRAGTTVSEMEIRSHAAGRLAYFKVPEQVRFVDEIPKGPTGKVQRIGMAQRLGFAAQRQSDPRKAATAGPDSDDAVERCILSLMEKSGGSTPIGMDTSFFETGGDSIQAGILLAEVSKQFGADIPLAAFMLEPTAAFIARIVRDGAVPAPETLVTIRKGGRNAPFFCVHPHDGRVTLFYALATCLDAEQPFHAFQAPSGEALRPAARGIERMAASYVRAMRAAWPGGPYYLGGYCFGALIAFEMARMLYQQHEEVAFLALIDSYAPGAPSPSRRGFLPRILFPALDRGLRVRPLLAYVSHLPAELRRQYLLNTIKAQITEWRSVIAGASAHPYSLPGRDSDRGWDFLPGQHEGSAVLFRPTREPLGFQRDPGMGWGRFIKGGLEIENIRGYHRSLIFKPANRLLGERLNFRLQAQNRGRSTGSPVFAGQ